MTTAKWLLLFVLLYQTGSMAAISIDDDPINYNGQLNDQESGLLYLGGARYYQSENTRFVQRDSVDLANRYNYGNANPILNIDPSGHFAIDSIGKWLFDNSGGNLFNVFFLAGSTEQMRQSIAIETGIGDLDFAAGLLDVITVSTYYISEYSKSDRMSTIAGYIGLSTNIASSGLGLASAGLSYQKATTIGQKALIATGGVVDLGAIGINVAQATDSNQQRQKIYNYVNMGLSTLGLIGDMYFNHQESKALASADKQASLEKTDLSNKQASPDSSPSSAHSAEQPKYSAQAAEAQARQPDVPGQLQGDNSNNAAQNPAD